MSTIFPFTVVCGLCGEEYTQHSVGSYSTFGGPDLDGRPAPMLRSTMSHWVKECPHCGYVRDRLDEAPELDRDTLLRVYREVETAYDWSVPEAPAQEPEFAFPAFLRLPSRLFDADEADSDSRPLEEKRKSPSAATGKALLGSNLAKRFAKFGAMLAYTGASAEAARQFLRAAWVFDDERDRAGAATWRRAAIKEAEGALRASGASSAGHLFCTLADMLRRCGEFQRVLALEPPVRLTESEERLFSFQKDLAERGDAGAREAGVLPGLGRQTQA